jgi:5-methylcytosine-specific restriction enzyme A
MAWSKLSRHERGYDARWVKLREIIITRDMGLCQPCKRNGRATVFNAVDHIMPKARGGTDDCANLECICTPCHDAKSLAEAAAAQGRTIKPKPTFTRDGRPVWD